MTKVDQKKFSTESFFLADQRYLAHNLILINSQLYNCLNWGLTILTIVIIIEYDKSKMHKRST